MPKLYFIIILFVLCKSVPLSAQNKFKVDSLLNTLKLNIADSSKAKSYANLYTEYKDKDPDKALGYIQACITFSKKSGFIKGLQLGYINKSVTLYGKGKYDSVIYLSKEVLKIHDSTCPKKNLGLAYNLLGVIEYRRGDFREALDYFLNSVKAFEKAGEKKNILYTLNNISSIYIEQKNYLKALEESRKCTKLCLELKDFNVLSATYVNQGVCFTGLGIRDSVVFYYKKSIEIDESTKNYASVAHGLNNLGAYYSDNKDYKKSIEYLEKSLKLRKTIEDPHGLAETQKHLGHSYLLNKDYEKARLILNEAEVNLKSIGVPRELSEVYSVQSQLLEEQGQLKEALNKYKLFKELHDSVFNTSSSEHITELIAKYDSDKKDKEISLLNQEKALKESEILAHKAISEKQNFQLNASLIGFLLILLFSLVLFRSYKQKQKINKVIESQKILVEEKNKSITDSINYAKRIQETILPSESLLSNEFLSHFILLKPKDIVSGDFYWAAKKENNFYLAVCDSTGHGVPGAFMSLMSISFLNEAIVEKNIAEPNKVFDYVRQRLVESVSKEDQKDGFDGTLICFNRKTAKITYASANSKPILISNGSINELPNDKMPVGKGERNESFKLFDIQLKKDDILYLYTDGFADQFGGVAGKKFKYKQLSDLLLNNCKEPLINQRKLLNMAFENWKSQLEQVDDVLVIGIKF